MSEQLRLQLVFLLKRSQPLQLQRQDRPSCPVCGLIYTEILISSGDAQRALNNAQKHPGHRICPTLPCGLFLLVVTLVCGARCKLVSTWNLVWKVEEKSVVLFGLPVLRLRTVGHTGVGFWALKRGEKYVEHVLTSSTSRSQTGNTETTTDRHNMLTNMKRSFIKQHLFSCCSLSFQWEMRKHQTWSTFRACSFYGCCKSYTFIFLFYALIIYLSVVDLCLYMVDHHTCCVSVTGYMSFYVICSCLVQN